MNQSERRRFEALLERIPNDAETVLDVGCARHDASRRNNANLHRLLHRELNASILGIDVVVEEIEKMKKEGFNVKVADAEKMDEQLESSFDVIIAGEVIEHLGRPLDFLQASRVLLNDGGKLILTTPNPDGFSYWRRALMNGKNNEGHTCWIDPFNLERLTVLDGSIKVVNWEYLPPTGGISEVLWKLGRQRAASPGYVATIMKC